MTGMEGEGVEEEVVEGEGEVGVEVVVEVVGVDGKVFCVLHGRVFAFLGLGCWGLLCFACYWN